MSQVNYKEGAGQNRETVSAGVEKVILRAEPGENRVLLRIAPGKGYPKYAHAVPDEVFVMEGIYVYPGVEGGKAFGPGSYLNYPAGTEHNATSPTGCTKPVWNTNALK